MFEQWTAASGKATLYLFYGGTLFVILGGIAVIILFIVMIKRYNKTVEIRKQVAGGCIKIDDKCRVWTDQEGNKWWVRWKEKDKLLRLMSEPPATSVITNEKGKEHAVAKLVDGHYIWMEDENNVASIPPNIFKDMPEDIINEKSIADKMKRERAWKIDKLNKWKTDNGIKFCFHPLTSNQRAIYTNALRRAEERRAKGWQSHIPMIVGLGAVVIILIALLIFYGNISKPALEMADKAIQFQNTQNEGLKILQEIKNDVQTIKEEKTTKVPGG